MSVSLRTHRRSMSEASDERDKRNTELTQLTTKVKNTLAPHGATLEKYSGGGNVDLKSVNSAREIQDYIAVAEHADHPEIVKALKSLKV